MVNVLMAAVLAASAGIAGVGAPGKVTLVSDLVPTRMNLQGYLTDASGNPVSGPRDFEFRIYRGVALQWQEAQACTVRQGLFHAVLGAVTAIPESIFAPGGARELELVVEGQALSPRVELSSAGFAFRSLKSDTATFAAGVSRPMSPAISAADIAERAVTMSKLDQAGAQPGQVLKWSGTIWQPGPDSAGGPPSGNAGGDLAGTYPNPTVARLRGRTVATTTPYSGDLLGYYSSQWTPRTPGGDISGEIEDIDVVGLRGRTISTTTPYTGDVLAYSSSQWTPLEIDGDVSGAVNDLTVTHLQGRPVSTSSPSTGQVLTWYSSQWTPRSLPFGARAGPWVETFGSVELANGRAEKRLPAEFLADAEIDASSPIRVFLQQTSGEPVLVVVTKGRDRFVVVGPEGSSAGFDYRAVAKRKAGDE